MTVDEIGVIVEVDETYDSDMKVTSHAKYYEGWHVNFTDYSPEIEDFLVHPMNPERVFLGVPTFFARFKDEDEWASIKEKMFPPEISEEN